MIERSRGSLIPPRARNVQKARKLIILLNVVTANNKVDSEHRYSFSTTYQRISSTLSLRFSLINVKEIVA